MRNAVAWLADYVYVAWWQVRNLVNRHAPMRYGRGVLAPVILLPGIFETWQFLRPVADRINRDGHPVYVIPELGYNRYSVAESARLAMVFLEHHGLRGVTLVAHSKGGLIGKHLMAVDDIDGRIDRLIAVNSPFSGSSYARYFPLRSIRAFSPTEPTLAMLAGNTSVNSRIASIFVEFDPHIPGGSALDGGQNIRLPLRGHFRPLSSRLLIDTVAHEISSFSGQGSLDGC